METKKNQYHPKIAFHPGETLAEKLEELNTIIGLTNFKNAVKELVAYLSFQDKINSHEKQRHTYIFYR